MTKIIILALFIAPLSMLGGWQVGYQTGLSQNIAVLPIVKVKEISILTEKKRCDEWGGEFRTGVKPYFDNEYTSVVWSNFSSDKDMDLKNVSCTKQITTTDEDGTVLTGTKELFNYQF